MKILTLIALLCVCSAAIADDPVKAVNPLQAADVSIVRLETKVDALTVKVDGLAETVGNANAGHEETKSLLKTLQTRVDTLLEMAAEQATSKLVPTPVPPAGNDADMHTAGPVKSSTPPQLKPEFEFLADDPDFCFECNRHLWLDPDAYYVPPVKSGALMLSHVPGPDGKHAPAATAATPVTGWKIICENGTCRRIPQQPAAQSPRAARKAARGK